MKTSLQSGVVGELSTRVGPGQTITLGNDRHATVFSTPAMIQLMEYAARKALVPHLDAGEESVGVDVQIAHVSATPPRQQVTAEATVIALDKNLITFEVVARDPWGEIGRGTHRRAVIETRKFADRLARQKGSSEQPSFAELAGQLQHLRCVLEGKLLRLTLDRPQKRNAMNAKLTEELERVVAWLEATNEEVRVVVVAGAGETFPCRR